MPDDDVTMKRLLRLEEEVDTLRDRMAASSPALALDAVASLRADSADRFERLTARVDTGFARMGEGFARMEERLSRVDECFAALDARLVELLRAVKARS